MNQDGAVRDLSRAMLVPFVLSVIAGSVDVIGFLGLDGLFIAHITGNLVVLAARSVAGEEASVAHSLSVPVFVMALATARLAAAGLARLSNPCLFGTQIPQNRLAAVRTCRYGIGSTMAVSRCRRGRAGPCAARLATVLNENLGGEEESIRRSHSLLRLLDQHLQSLDWLALGRPTLADVAIYNYAAHAAEGNVDLSGYQNVNRWLKRVEDLLGVIPLMQTPAGLRSKQHTAIG